MNHVNAMQCTNRPFTTRLVPIIRQNFHAWRNYILKMEVAISSETPATAHSHISSKTVITVINSDED